MELESVRYELSEAVATVTIDRERQRNALNDQVLRELTDCMRRASKDPLVRGVVLTGSGDRAFCAGADLTGFADPSGTELEHHRSRGLFVELFQSMRQLGKPVVAAVNGHALAGGLGLALSADLIVCSEAAEFGTPEIRVGVWPMMIMPIIARNIGRKRALQLFMTAERISAATALDWGMVNRVVAADRVMPEARQLALQLCRFSPLVMQLGRDAFYATEDLDFDAALDYLQAQLTLVSLTEDFREGVTAFLEHREPRFQGR